MPRRLFVIGGGPIGCEMAQSFARFGSQVTLADVAPRLLNNDDPDAAALVRAALDKDGVQVRVGVQIDEVRQAGDDKQVVISVDGQQQVIDVDEILVAAGRKPNTDGLGLEKVGVEVGPRGVVVNEKLQTTNKRIFACGDIAIPWQFTHTADATARIVIQNALFFGRKKWTDLIVPWVTYTDPEVAHVGKTQKQLLDANIDFDEYKVDLDDVDRALLDGETDGYVSVLTRAGGDQILGATIVASHAGEMINEISLAMAAGKGLGFISGIIHPYPTQAEAIRKAGDAFNRTRLTPLAAAFLKLLLKLRG